MSITSHRVVRCARSLFVAELFMRYYSEDYRGVHALTKIPTDDVILYVPYKYIMTSEVAKGSEIGKKIIASGVELRSTHSYLAAYLLQEKHKGKKSFWEPYLRILPEFYNNMVRHFLRAGLRVSPTRCCSSPIVYCAADPVLGRHAGQVAVQLVLAAKDRRPHRLTAPRIRADPEGESISLRSPLGLTR